MAEAQSLLQIIGATCGHENQLLKKLFNCFVGPQTGLFFLINLVIFHQIKETLSFWNNLQLIKATLPHVIMTFSMFCFLAFSEIQV